jgi:trypsin
MYLCALVNIKSIVQYFLFLQGDSGGPVLYSNVVIGIVSWGHGCANETYPDVSTNVASYTDWIVSVAV